MTTIPLNIVHQLVVAFPAKSAERLVPPVAGVVVTAAYTITAVKPRKINDNKTNIDLKLKDLARLLNQEIIVKGEKNKKN